MAALSLALRARRGSRPTVHRELPHSQLDQQPDVDVRAQLERRFLGFTGVELGPSEISVPGAQALRVPSGSVAGPAEAFIVGREFAHLHPLPDSSLHMALPSALAARAVEAEWAELHPLSGSRELAAVIVMVYAPRDENELDVVMGLVAQSHRFATTSATQLDADT
jgi:hypothetical protein